MSPSTVPLIFATATLMTAFVTSAPVLTIRAGHYLRQAFAITLLNPKAIVFYMAFFPLFVDPARPAGIETFAAMAATIAALTFCYGAIVTVLTHRLAARLRADPRVGRLFGRAAGVFMIGFGLKLALSR